MMKFDSMAGFMITGVLGFANLNASLAFAQKKAENPETVKKAAKKEKAPATTKGNDMTHVTIVTSLGTIKLELDSAKAPKTVENFVGYVKAGHYNGTIFHRVIPGFMIQGGGFDEKMTEKATKAPVQNEASNGLKNDRATVAMARTSDPNSATAQFFINTVNNDFLNYTPSNPGYAVFGHVTEGLDVLDKIAKVKTGQKGMYSDVPVTPVVMTSVTIDK